MGWAGPLAGRYLADLGADVLKIESSAQAGLVARLDPVPGADPTPLELPRNFMCVNRNKRGLDLDLADPGELARRQGGDRAPRTWCSTTRARA